MNWYALAVRAVGVLIGGFFVFIGIGGMMVNPDHSLIFPIMGGAGLSFVALALFSEDFVD